MAKEEPDFKEDKKKSEEIRCSRKREKKGDFCSVFTIGIN